MAWPPKILWLNLVCLDAPLVAIGWQGLFANRFGVHVSLAARAVLFLTTWAIYLADRLADAGSVPVEQRRSTRQAFCKRHAHAFLGALLLIALADAVLVLLELDPRLLITGGVLGGLTLGYLLTNRLHDRTWRVVPIKEACIGTLFALGTVAPMLPPASERHGFVLSVLLFAGLCTLNCLSVAAWERRIDQEQAKTSIATRWPQLGRMVVPIALALATLCALSASHHAAPPRLVGLMGACALLLAALHRSRGLPAAERTALADLALLGPVLLGLAVWAA